MMTIDDVITALEGSARSGIKDDAIAYLKAYKDDREDLTALRAFWAEQQENKPLTWDELKRMIGKPVFITSPFFSWQWYIIYSCRDDVGNLQDFSALTGIDYNGHYIKFSKQTMSHTWQAYRKERKK